MRRLAVYAVVVLAAGLVLAPSALASTGIKHAAAGVRHAAPAGGVRHAASAGAAFSGLGDPTTYAISGRVLDFDHTPTAGAEVDWGWWDNVPNYNVGGSNISQSTPNGTDSSGAFRFGAVTSAPLPGNDDLRVYYPTLSGLTFMDSWSLNFSTKNDITPFSYEMQPAHVTVNIDNAPASPAPEVKVGQMDTGYAVTEMPLTAGSGVAGVLPSSFDDVIAYYFHVAGNPYYRTCLAQTEWLSPGTPPAPVNVSAGVLATDPVHLDWNLAQYAYLAGPSWQHSGKPGTTVKMVLKGWPAGQQSQFAAYYGAGSYVNDPITSSGAGTHVVSLRIRPNAPVDVYEVDTYRADATDSFVDLWDYFQVCTFKASASAIHHGKAMRLSGKVPGTGSVTIFSTTHKVAGQPATLAAKGWVKGGSYKIKSGKFLSGLLHPKRTTWYVAKYRGYDFWAFTSVVKVTVH
jgi:hypothetical protein